MKHERLEMVGSATQPITLTGTAQTMSVGLHAPSGPAAVAAGPAAAVAPAKSGKTYLHIENVASDQSHATYEVYVNLPPGADPAANKDHYAGMMPLFGVLQASQQTDRHAGNGLGFSMDITRLVDRLKAKNAWDDKSVNVTFVPRRTGGTADAAGPGHHPIRVGRVSVYKA